MHIKLSLLALLMSLAFMSAANDISFVVYFTKGAVSKNASAIKKGDKILANDNISIGDNASVLLVCSNYKVIQLNKKGQYSAKKLLAQCNTTAAAYSSAYFKYVWDEVTHPHGKPESNPGEYMKNVGAVSRGCNSVATGIPADTIHYNSGMLPLYWQSNFTTSVIAIFDMPVDGAPLQKTILQKGQPVNFQQLVKTFTPGEYYWHITDEEGNGCERNYLKIWEAAAYGEKIKTIRDAVPVSSPAETAFATGFVLEENHFLAEAIQYYTLAARLDSSNNIYSTTLSRFYATEF